MSDWELNRLSQTTLLENAKLVKDKVVTPEITYGSVRVKGSGNYYCRLFLCQI